MGTKYEIGIDGHGVLLIPHPPNAPPHLTNQRAGRDCGAHGAVGVGDGSLEEYLVHMNTCTYTHMLVPGLQWERNGNSKNASQTYSFSIIPAAK